MTSPTFKTPLVGIETCKSVLGRTEDQVLSLIESGKLRFCFNLAAPDAHRAMYRVLSLSLVDFAFGTSTQPGTETDAFKYILPGSQTEVRCSAVARAFNVSGTHVHGLIRTGCLQLARPGRFPKDSPQVSRASAVEFLKSRRCV